MAEQQDTATAGAVNEELSKWSLVKLPPEGDPSVGPFGWRLFEISKDEKERLHLPPRWKANYKLYIGDHVANKVKNLATNIFNKIMDKAVVVNLFFANVQRTIANITARNPVAEVVDLDGLSNEDGADTLLTVKLLKWWKDSGQEKKLATTALKMEKYGITIEKAIPKYVNEAQAEADIIVVDPYSFFPCPGNYEDISMDCPYIAFAYPENVETVEEVFDVTGVEADDTYSLLGLDRERSEPAPSGTYIGSANYAGNFNPVAHPATGSKDVRQAKALIVELWIRDYTKKKSENPVIELDESGEPVLDDEGNKIILDDSVIEEPKYPGGIRVITFTNKGRLLLDDKSNPNINPNLSPEKARASWLHDHFPVWKENSYEDTTNIWGFSAAEQVSDLNMKINDIFTRMAIYILRCMFPPLIIPRTTGITASMINTKPNLVFFPADPITSAAIRFVPVPNLPSNFFSILDAFITSFDRIYQIEDADRGVVPKGVTAASAIVALQERNAVLMQHKIRGIDRIVENRGRAEISMIQQFGGKAQSISVGEERIVFTGIDYAGRNFNYVVESGSTTPRTSVQIEQQATDLYQMGAIDRQALLESLNFPNWKRIIERAGEGQVDQALQILIQAGMEKEEALKLRQYLMQPQGGPGNVSSHKTGPAEARPGKVRAAQGGNPPVSVVAAKGGE